MAPDSAKDAMARTEDLLRAMYEQARALLSEGRDDEAEQLLLTLQDSGHPHYGSVAALALCASYNERGRYVDAKRMAERVIAVNHPEHVPWGYRFLGSVLDAVDDVEGALAAYRHAAHDVRLEHRLPALISVGQLQAVLGQVEPARTTYQQVIDTGHSQYAPEALASLAQLLYEQGDLSGAKHAVQRLAGSGHPDFAPQSAYNLAVLLRDEGAREGTIQALQQAAESGDPQWSQRAQRELTRLNARTLPLEALHNDDPSVPPRIAYDRAQTLRRKGNLAEARAAYLQLANSADPQYAGRAMNDLSAIAFEQRNLPESQLWFELSVTRNREHLAEIAYDGAADFYELGDLIGARALLTKAMNTRISPIAEQSAELLTRLLYQHIADLFSRASRQEAHVRHRARP